MSAVGQALGTDLPPIPRPRPDPRIAPAAPAAAPTFDMSTAGANLLSADKGVADASQALAASEGKVGEAQAGLQAEQGKYLEGLHAKEEAELRGLDQGPFQPRQDTLAEMGSMFMLIGMAGAFLGSRGGASAAANAQAALSGAIEGWNKGDQQEAQRQLQAFNTNAAYLKDKADKIREIYKQYDEDALKVGIPTAQGRLEQKLLTEAQADVNAQKVRLAGAQAGAKQAEDILKVSEALETKRMTLQSEMNRQAEAFQQKMILAQMAAGRQLGNTLDAADVNEMADEYIAGNKSVSMGLGYGLAGQANRKAFHDAVVAKMQAKGMSGADITKAQADLAGTFSSERALGTQAGRVQGAIGALQQTVPLALDASNKVDRTQFPKLNDIENAVRTGTGDTNIVVFNAYNQALVNDYAQIMRRGGATTDESSRRANDILSTSFSNGQYAAGVNALNQEATAVQNGLASARDVVAGKHVSRETPTQKDRDWVKSHPADRQKFIDHFGVAP